MVTRRIADPGIRPLHTLGINEPEERAYRYLLEHSSATAQEIARALTLPQAKVQSLLDIIETKGLATHSPQRPRRYIPVSPDIALESLVFQRQEDLRLARLAVHEIREQAAARRHKEPEQVVELITSREAERQAYELMQRTARHEVVTLVRLPLRISRLDVPHEQNQKSQREARNRGVRYRSVVDAEFLSLPRAVSGIRSDIRAGEEVRTISALPFKLMLADRQLAFIPLNLSQLDGSSLLVRPSALLDALYALFEIFWERAAPITFTRTGELKKGAPDSRLPEEVEDLVPLLAAGLNDKAIAYELGISTRTLERRVAELMHELGTRTRFQAGWLAALRLFGADAAKP